MLPLHTFGQSSRPLPDGPLKVLSLDEALGTRLPHGSVLVMPDEDDKVPPSAIARLGFAGIVSRGSVLTPDLPVLHSLRDPDVVAPGDAVQVHSENGQVQVLFRRRSTSNSLFITERCNSYCLMCSQPPRETDDDWRIDHLTRLIGLIDDSTEVLGVTGGEPTLLGGRLGQLLQHASATLPRTNLHVLTNGRLFEDKSLVREFSGLERRITWGIPLYADVPDVHDYVVQSCGAFFETIEGIYNLAQAGHLIEIRFVVSKATLPRLEAFAEFLLRNVPFAAHVALMGLEPMGFAKRNRELLWVDPTDYAERVASVAERLDSRGMPVSIYNMPLCVLPEQVWPLAQRSISDWKQVYDSNCESCSVRSRCAGFFRSAGENWKPRALRPIESAEATHG